MSALVGIGAAVMLVAGVFLIVTGMKRSQQDNAFRDRAVRAQGVVADVRWEQHRKSDGRISLIGYPVFQFHTADGRPITAGSQVGTNAPRHQPGQRVVVLYDPANPQQASIEGDSASTFLSTGQIGLGAALVAAGVCGGGLAVVLLFV